MTKKRNQRVTGKANTDDPALARRSDYFLEADLPMNSIKIMDIRDNDYLILVRPGSASFQITNVVNRLKRQRTRLPTG